MCQLFGEYNIGLTFLSLPVNITIDAFVVRRRTPFRHGGNYRRVAIFVLRKGLEHTAAPPRAASIGQLHQTFPGAPAKHYRRTGVSRGQLATDGCNTESHRRRAEVKPVGRGIQSASGARVHQHPERRQDSRANFAGDIAPQMASIMQPQFDHGAPEKIKHPRYYLWGERRKQKRNMCRRFNPKKLLDPQRAYTPYFRRARLNLLGASRDSRGSEHQIELKGGNLSGARAVRVVGITAKSRKLNRTRRHSRPVLAPKSGRRADTYPLGNEWERRPESGAGTGRRSRPKAGRLREPSSSKANARQLRTLRLGTPSSNAGMEQGHMHSAAASIPIWD
ncbi:hypothetical protein JB92DRAFT_2828039 [Gautieria morchelliformis]|nr:hypothetical protein JB92DRAFT_2828039 [Gautieria morchelliformis]